MHGARIADLGPPPRAGRSGSRPGSGPGDDLEILSRQRPALVFAVLGQAKAAGLLSPEAENRLLSDLLTAWAVRSSLDPGVQGADGQPPALTPGLPAPIPSTPGLARATL